MATHDERLAAARELGREHARNAASWATDGNTDPEHARRVLRMLDEGDPAAWDYLPPQPNLSGEFSDGMTPGKLAYEIGGWTSGACDAYEEAASETFEVECEKQLRACAGEQALLLGDPGEARERNERQVTRCLGRWSNDA